MPRPSETRGRLLLCRRNCVTCGRRDTPRESPGSLLGLAYVCACVLTRPADASRPAAPCFLAKSTEVAAGRASCQRGLFSLSVRTKIQNYVRPPVHEKRTYAPEFGKTAGVCEWHSGRRRTDVTTKRTPLGNPGDHAAPAVKRSSTIMPGLKCRFRRALDVAEAREWKSCAPWAGAFVATRLLVS